MEMPFGKYKGRDIRRIPIDYLEWLSSLPDLRPRLKQAVAGELRRRAGADKEDSPPSSVSTSIPAYLQELARKLVDKGYRHLSKDLHPDLGGNTEDMQKLNETIEVMRRIVG